VVGCLGLLARGLRYSIDLSRLFLVVIAVSKSALCPSYVFLDFLVIQFRRFILTYRVGGQPFEDTECLLSPKRSCLVRCPLTRPHWFLGRLTRPHWFLGILPPSSLWLMTPMISRFFTTYAKDIAAHVPRLVVLTRLVTLAFWLAG